MQRWNSYRRRLIDVFAAIVFAAAVGGAGWLFNKFYVLAPDTEFLSQLEQAYPDVDRETALAERYWSFNHDVRDNPHYGRGGRLGIYGARVHYRRFGKKEFRAWPIVN
jgi:hypothetical protein